MRPPSSLLAALIGLGASVPFAGRALATPPASVDKLVDDGSRKLEGGDLDGAIAVFARAQEAAPQDPRPRFLRGAALAKKKDFAGAIAAYREALARDGKLAPVHNELGTVLLDQGKPDEAIGEFKAAVQAQPDLAEGWANLGRAHAARGQLDEAVAAWKKGAAKAPRDADLRIDLSSALRRLHRLDEATAAAREAVSLSAGDANTHLNLGLCLLEAKKPGDAEAELIAATRLDSKSALAEWTLAAALRAQKKYPAALAALEKATALKPSPAILADQAEVLRELGQPARAEKVLRDALAGTPRSLALHIALARTLAAAKKCADADRELGALPQAKDEVKAAATAIRAACPARGAK